MNKVIEKHTFKCVNDSQEFTLSKGIWLFELWGAQGGCQDDSECLGGYSSAQIIITEPTQIFIYVGGKGEITNTATPDGGYNGGGDGHYGTGVSDGKEVDRGIGGGGGGGTDIQLYLDDRSTKIIVAGGGGGQGSYLSGTYYGGCGGGETGEDGEHGSLSDAAGKKGTSSNGGAGGISRTYGNATAGTLGQGGNAFGISYCGGGGGGGYYGGGGSYESGGGGGSGYIHPLLAYVTMKAGVKSGDGKVVLTKLIYAATCKETNFHNYFFFITLLITRNS